MDGDPGPRLVQGEVDQRVLWVGCLERVNLLSEGRAASVPTRVAIYVAGNAVFVVGVVAVPGAVFASACSARVVIV